MYLATDFTRCNATTDVFQYNKRQCLKPAISGLCVKCCPMYGDNAPRFIVQGNISSNNYKMVIKCFETWSFDEKRLIEIIHVINNYTDSHIIDLIY